MLGQGLDQQSGAFKIASALQFAQSQGKDGLADFIEHSAGLATTPYLGTIGRHINQYGFPHPAGGGISPTKKDAGPKGPGESNREASRLGDVGS